MKILEDRTLVDLELRLRVEEALENSKEKTFDNIFSTVSKEMKNVDPDLITLQILLAMVYKQMTSQTTMPSYHDGDCKFTNEEKKVQNILHKENLKNLERFKALYSCFDNTNNEYIKNHFNSLVDEVIKHYPKKGEINNIFLRELTDIYGLGIDSVRDNDAQVAVWRLGRIITQLSVMTESFKNPHQRPYGGKPYPRMRY